MGGLVSGGKELAQYPGAELLVSGSRWTPALGNGGCRIIEDIPELAAIE